jgi:hypothetical protein
MHAIERRWHFHSPDDSPPQQNGDAGGNYQADERNLFLLHQLSAPSPAADALAIIPDPAGLKNFSSIREQEQHTGDFYLGRGINWMRVYGVLGMATWQRSSLSCARDIFCLVFMLES